MQVYGLDDALIHGEDACLWMVWARATYNGEDTSNVE